VPGDDWEMAKYESEFHVGLSKSPLRPKGDPKYFSDGHYLDIVPTGELLAPALCTRAKHQLLPVCARELLADGSGTRLILTDQSVYFGDREKPADRKTGWGRSWTGLVAQMSREAV